MLPGDVTKYVSEYAEYNAAEFVTEVWTGLLNERTFPKKILDAFDHLLGPAIL